MSLEAATTYSGSALTFDPMDKMITAVIGSNTVSARYRADGLRAWKGTNVSIPTSGGTPVSNATYYLYDGGNPVVEMNSSGTVTKVNVFAHDGLVARGLGTTWTYYQFDPQGSVAQRTNTSGTVTSSSKYEAYGKHVNVPGSTTDVYGWNARWGYYFDSETGLYLCQQRYYDSSQGRWLNRDPISYAGGINLYGYCGGGPVGSIDPEGEDFYKWLVTGDWNADDEVYESGLVGLWDSWSSGEGTRVGAWGAAEGLTFGLVQPDDSIKEHPGYGGSVGLGRLASVCFAVGGALKVAGVGSRLAFHGSHHNFGTLGRLPHWQMNIWRVGVKNSGKVVRVPLPRWTWWK